MTRSLNRLEPADLIEERCRAFREGDFGFVYDSYHPDSLFLQQFPDREDYLRYGRDVLARDFQIRRWRILRQRQIAADEVRLIFYLETRFRGETAEILEMATIIHTRVGWRYQGGQKMERREFPGPVETITFADFEKMREKIFF